MSLTLVANLPLVLLTPVGNLPPLSRTLAKLVEKCVAGVVDIFPPVSTTLAKLVEKFAVDTGGKLDTGVATGVVDTGGAP